MAAGLGSCSGQARAQVHQGGSGISQACEALAFLAHAPASATSTTAIPTSIGSSKLRSFSLRFICKSEEHTSALQSLMRISYAAFCLQKITYSTTNKNS